MQFTYNAYEQFINSVIVNGYRIIDYEEESSKGVILRHDVDYSLKKTVRIAEIEHDCGVSSTFFIMITSDFYNVFSQDGRRISERLLSLGHDIGLHFDEMRYPDLEGKGKEISEKIILEAEILSRAIGKKVTKVSMHRPSQEIIEADLEIPGIINTYSSKYFSEFKYLSDSRRRWREPALEIISGGKYNRLQVLVHPFWYNDEELSLSDSIRFFVNSSNYERYQSFNDNFTNLSEVMLVKDVIGE